MVARAADLDPGALAPERFREIFRFSWLHLADVGVMSSAPAMLAFLVNAFFGAMTLGQLNIALRIVDPLSMALMGVGHNIAFSVLVRLQGDPPRLIRTAGDIAAGVAVVTVPAFVGLAASAPVLLPLLVGPGWELAVPLSQILCLAVGMSLPYRFYYSSYSALGRPEYGLIGSTVGLICMAAAFLIVARLDGHFAAPGAFLTFEITTTVVALIYAQILLPGPRRRPRCASAGCGWRRWSWPRRSPDFTIATGFRSFRPPIC